MRVDCQQFCSATVCLLDKYRPIEISAKASRPFTTICYPFIIIFLFLYLRAQTKEHAGIYVRVGVWACAANIGLERDGVDIFAIALTNKWRR